MNRTRSRAIQHLLLAAGLGVLSGCASYPVSKTLRQQAKPVSLAQVTASPSAYTGTMVIWGGQVIQTVNDTNGGAIYVLKLPLNRQGRPERHGSSPGRFIARRNGFIDPEVFRKGRLITVAGALTGVATQPLQKVQYPYAVVTIEELHLWHRRPPSYYYPGWGWGGYGPMEWNWDWYGPGWGWGWYGPDWDWD